MRKNKKILVIEDNETVMSLITFKLKAKGFSVIAFDGKDKKGFEYAVARSYDLLILDIMLPYMSGHEIVLAIRNSKKHKNTPVIMLSAKTLEKDVLYAFELGASDYIKKPFSPTELIARIETRFAR